MNPRGVVERLQLERSVTGDAGPPGEARDPKGEWTAGAEEYQGLLEKQRSLEGLRAAVRDPGTGKTYVGKNHADAYGKLPPDVKARVDATLIQGYPRMFRLQGPHVGFVDPAGKWLDRGFMDEDRPVSVENKKTTLRRLKSQIAKFHQSGEDEQAHDANPLRMAMDAVEGKRLEVARVLSEDASRVNPRRAGTPAADAV